ncbi:unnamed protein product [Schistocephalus solidus]|uniref:Uncharacterized protein n=1 Tax=Schistocephalus solidus TaxID=70667 RepID=A0A183SUI2_SCHSO|nr:unnamed protein product [Schistocephalus solidus]
MLLDCACRGSQLDPGTVVETDGLYPGNEGAYLGSLRRIPVEADLLVAYAVQPGLFISFSFDSPLVTFCAV